MATHVVVAVPFLIGAVYTVNVRFCEFPELHRHRSSRGRSLVTRAVPRIRTVDGARVKLVIVSCRARWRVISQATSSTVDVAVGIPRTIPKSRNVRSKADSTI